MNLRKTIYYEKKTFCGAYQVPLHVLLFSKSFIIGDFLVRVHIIFISQMRKPKLRMVEDTEVPKGFKSSPL